MHFTNGFTEILDRMQRSQVAGLQTLAKVETCFTIVFVLTIAFFSTILLYCHWCYYDKEVPKSILDNRNIIYTNNPSPTQK